MKKIPKTSKNFGNSGLSQ